MRRKTLRKRWKFSRRSTLRHYRAQNAERARLSRRNSARTSERFSLAIPRSTGSRYFYRHSDFQFDILSLAEKQEISPAAPDCTITDKGPAERAGTQRKNTSPRNSGAERIEAAAGWPWLRFRQRRGKFVNAITRATGPRIFHV